MFPRYFNIHCFCAAGLVFGSAPGVVVAMVAAQAVDISGRVGLDGDSSLHKYHLDAIGYSAVVRPKPGASGGVVAWARANQIESVVLTIPVARIRSGDSHLDDNMRRALDAKDHPDITFNVSSTNAKGVGQSFPLELTGVLEVAGVRKPETLQATASVDHDTLRLQGTKHLKMTDFKVDPPKFMGLLKASDDIDVTFDVTLQKKVAAAATP
jgi:polyisoprenoid-binding protein YceI